MKLSELIKVLAEEIASRGDAELTEKYGEIWRHVQDAKCYKTPYCAPEGTVYLELTPGTAADHGGSALGAD